MNMQQYISCPSQPNFSRDVHNTLHVIRVNIYTHTYYLPVFIIVYVLNLKRDDIFMTLRDLLPNF